MPDQVSSEGHHLFIALPPPLRQVSRATASSFALPLPLRQRLTPPLCGAAVPFTAMLEHEALAPVPRPATQPQGFAPLANAIAHDAEDGAAAAVAAAAAPATMSMRSQQQASGRAPRLSGGIEIVEDHFSSPPPSDSRPAPHGRAEPQPEAATAERPFVSAPSSLHESVTVSRTLTPIRYRNARHFSATAACGVAFLRQQAFLKAAFL